MEENGGVFRPLPACRLQDRLEAQPVRFMETEALPALRQAQLAVARVSSPHC